MTDVSPRALAVMIRSLAVLALPAEDQVVWLRSLGLGEPAVADELALELEDGALLSRQFEEAGYLPERTCQLVREIDEQLTALSDPANTDFWRVESLFSAPEWAAVRKLAQEALFAIS